MNSGDAIANFNHRADIHHGHRRAELFNLLLYPFYFLSLVLQLASEIRISGFNLLTDARVLVNLLFEPLKSGRVVKFLEPLLRKVNLPIYGLVDDPLELRRSISALSG